MNLNDIIIVGGIATFLLPIVYLMGYARREKQQAGWAGDSRKAFKAERDALCAKHMGELLRERSVIRELEISLLHAGEAIEREVQNHAATERNRQISDCYRKAIIEALVMANLWDFVKHSDVPTNMLKILLDNAAQHAVDPAVNQKAKNLHTRGVRKGAKMGREQMRKLMQKSIDSQCLTIDSYRNERDVANKRRMRFTEAVTNVLNDKIALPGVRRALTQAIIVEHDRLRAIEAKQGV